MRILLITPIRFWGGGEHFLANLGQGLLERDHDVLLVANPGSAVAQRGRKIGLEVEEVSLRGELDPRTLLAVRRLARKWNPGVVLANMDKAIRILALAGVTRKVPVVRRLGMSTPFPDAWRFRYTYRRLVDRLVVNARGTAEVLAELNPWIPSDKVVVIPGAVDIDVLDGIDRSRARSELKMLLGTEEERPIVVAIGRLVRQKRPDVLVEALRILGGAAPHALWLGEGDLMAEIAEQAERVGVRLTLTGFRDDATNLLAGADLFVQPSRAEGMPHSVLESMALGVPVIGTSTSGILELLEGGRGFLIPVGDPQALAGAIADALEKREETARRVAAARELVEQEHDYPQMIERYEALFSEVMGRRGV